MLSDLSLAVRCVSLRVTVLHPLPPGTAVSAVKTLGKCLIRKSVVGLYAYAASLHAKD